jgi:zinc transport system substrate-binding protein
MEKMGQKRWRVIWFFVAIVFMLGGVMGILLQTKTPLAHDKPTLVVSTFALYEVAHNVGGDALNVRSIVPLGSDAHLFSPNPQDVIAISHSDLFIYNGGGFERWVEPLRQTLPSTMRSVDMSTKVNLLGNDPHYWLDIDNMILMTQTLEEECSKLLPAQSALFHRNAQNYITQLQQLKLAYRQGLSECKNRVLVTNHNAFGYLAHANDLENVTIIGLSSDAQPSSATIASVVELVKKRHVKTIFFEEFISDHVAQTIAQESGAGVQSLQPLENISEDALKSHQTYLSLMGENLTKIREAMECR